MGCTLFVSGESVTMKGISPIGDRKYLGLGEKLQPCRRQSSVSSRDSKSRIAEARPCDDGVTKGRLPIATLLQPWSPHISRLHMNKNIETPQDRR